MVMPTLYYLEHRSVLEWMIYRFVVSHLTGTMALLLFSASYLTDKMVCIALNGSPQPSPRTLTRRFLASNVLWVMLTLLVGSGIALVVPSFIELVRTGSTYEHWSRFIGMSFLLTTAMVMVVTRAIDHVLDLLAGQISHLRAEALGSS